MNVLKIFYFPRLVSLKVSRTPLLYPFLGPILKKSIPYITAAFENINYDSSYLSLVNDVKTADYILLPNNYWMTKKYDPELIKEYVKQAKSYGKSLLIDAYGDSTDPVDIPNAIVMRTSLYRQRKKPNEIIVPAYTQDLLIDYYNGRFVPRIWRSTPVIGFVGWGKAHWRVNPKIWLKSFFVSPKVDTEGLILRQKMLDSLKNDGNLKTNFIFRENYGGHINTAKGDIAKLRQEFVENIFTTDYTVCVRGAGNYSYRFYETMSLGRIPIVLDTDQVFPLEEEINYKKFCLFIPINNLSKAQETILDFHLGLTPADFQDRQKRVRQIFSRYLRLDSFTKYLVSDLLERKRKTN